MTNLKHGDHLKVRDGRMTIEHVDVASGDPVTFVNSYGDMGYHGLSRSTVTVDHVSPNLKSGDVLVRADNYWKWYDSHLDAFSRTIHLPFWLYASVLVLIAVLGVVVGVLLAPLVY